MLDAVGDGIVLLDESARIVDMNLSALELCEIGGRDEWPKTLSAFFPEIDVARAVSTLLEQSRPRRVLDARLTTAGGRVVPVQVSASEADDAGRRLRVLVIRDLRPIVAAQRRALETERLAAIGETITALAHESRNALQRMQACLTLLRLRGNEEVTELTDDMQAVQDQLQRLYEEVRNFAAPMQLKLQRVDVPKLLKTVRRELRMKWSSKQLTWSLQLKNGASSVPGDPEKLGQVFRNVLENAIDASPSGGKISVGLHETRADRDEMLEVHVMDQGPGIADSAKQAAFDLLFTTKPDGTGMGLAIARRIVREHDGEIVLENHDGGGARVVVSLPRGE